MRYEGFGGVRFDGDLRPPVRRSRGRAGVALLVAAVAGILGAAALGHDDEPAAASAVGTNTEASDSAGVSSGAVNAGAPTGGPLQVSRAAFLEPHLQRLAPRHRPLHQALDPAARQESS